MNVLLILSDHFRSDCLKHVGNEVIRTPNLDRLASEGVSFSASPLQPSDPSERLKTPLDKAGSSAHTNDNGPYPSSYNRCMPLQVVLPGETATSCGLSVLAS